MPVTWRIGDAWHTAAELAPNQLVTTDRPVDIDPARPCDLSYQDCAELVDEAAGWLREAGVDEWDRVAILKNHHFDFMLLFCAAARIGAIPVLMSGSYGPDYAHLLLRRLNKPVVVTDRDHVAKCGLDKDAVASLTKRVVCVDSTEGRPDLLCVDDVRGASPPPVRMRDFGEPVAITHTSGTTGPPKLASHSSESLLAVAVVENEKWPVFGWRESDTFAYCDPYWHERTLCLQLAITSVRERLLMLSGPDIDTARALFTRHRPTYVEALPNIWLHWEPLAADPARPFSDTRIFLNSFDAIHTRTIRTFLHASDRRHPVWLQAWSQTETGTMALRPFWRRDVRRRGHYPPTTQTIGWPIPLYGRMRAVDPTSGRPVRRGEVGLIQVSQPGRCLDYVGESDRYDRKRDGDWWHTGDLGMINRWGAVRIVDREVDRVPDGSAIAIEDVLLDRLPYTTEVVVLPVVGALPQPVYSTRDDKPISPDEWARAVTGLPALAEPRHIRWHEFPRTGSWKIRRVQLREELFPNSRTVGVGRWT